MNTNVEGPDGTQIPQQKRINVTIFQNSQDLQDQLKMIGDLSEKGQTDQA